MTEDLLSILKCFSFPSKYNNNNNIDNNMDQGFSVKACYRSGNCKVYASAPAFFQRPFSNEAHDSGG